MKKNINEIEVKDYQILSPMENQVTPVKDISQMSANEIKAYLKKQQEKEQKALEKERKEYEQTRDANIFKMLSTARALCKELSEFKQFCHINMEQNAVALEKYGKIRSNSKGGFSITNSDDTMKVTRRRDTEPVWDERSQKAVELIKDFLMDTIKKRDLDMFEILMSFLERNSKGDLEYARVMDLYKHEDKFDDERWKEGLRLIKESFSNHLKGFAYQFSFKGEDGKWVKADLNFSSL